ncbi:unnamed protein product [Hydatigera taeniaeformis]|uniref:BTB domain-containing protein n=1 Tax=Hydatigena taeniaeformis TaxID=6205 RepID=A0A0R3WJU2_HYDTA|nr:unnamed protein product [Hydatigera taeniaeformis]
MNALTPDPSETDSDCEYKYVFPLRHEVSPRDYLKFILTVWYCPETSAAIADLMADSYGEAQLKELLASPMEVLLFKSRKFFLELNI